MSQHLGQHVLSDAGDEGCLEECLPRAASPLYRSASGLIID
jgi:hypothetical protein